MCRWPTHRVYVTNCRSLYISSSILTVAVNLLRSPSCHHITERSAIAKILFPIWSEIFQLYSHLCKNRRNFLHLVRWLFLSFPDCPVFCPCLSYSMISKNVEGDKSYWLLLVPYPPFSILGNRALKLPFCYGFVLKWSIVKIPSHVTSWNSKIEDEEGVQS